MAKYLWMNPVAEKMYGDELPNVIKNLEKLGFELVECEPQLTAVQEKYVKHSKTTKQTMLDCRCPETIRLLEQHGLTYTFEVPKIEPILVHTARVLYDLYVKDKTDTLIITCPCTQLRDFTAERLKEKEEVICYTWKEFMELQGKTTTGTVDMTPIPLGFFDSAFEHVLKISEEEEIIREITKLVKEQQTAVETTMSSKQDQMNGNRMGGIDSVTTNAKNKYEIVEMLYCKDGCHNGNGL